MRGSSAESYARLLSALPAGSAQLGDELMAAAEVLRSNVSLRRASTDTASPTSVRTQVLTAVFGPHLGADAASVVEAAGELRWAQSIDLPEALDRLGAVAIVRAADAAGEGDRVESELFTFGRAVATNPDLRDALADESRTVADRQDLISAVLGGRAAAATLRLARETVTGSHRTVTIAVDEFIEIAAEARNRKVATVRTASPISAEQQERLRGALGREAGSEVHLNVIVDASLVGGLLIEIGDYVIDGTVGTRLDDVRRRIAG